MGTQKNRLNETVLLSTQNKQKFILTDKKILTILRSKVVFIVAYVRYLCDVIEEQMSRN